MQEALVKLTKKHLEICTKILTFCLYPPWNKMSCINLKNIFFRNKSVSRLCKNKGSNDFWHQLLHENVFYLFFFNNNKSFKANHKREKSKLKKSEKIETYFLRALIEFLKNLPFTFGYESDACWRVLQLLSAWSLDLWSLLLSFQRARVLPAS